MHCRMRALVLVLALVGCHPGPDPEAQKATIGAAAEEFIHLREPAARVNIVVERLEGDYARLRVIPTKLSNVEAGASTSPAAVAGQADDLQANAVPAHFERGGIGYARREGPAWKVLAIAPAFDAAFYARAGIPATLQAR